MNDEILFCRDFLIVDEMADYLLKKEFYVGTENLKDKNVLKRFLKLLIYRGILKPHFYYFGNIAEIFDSKTKEITYDTYHNGVYLNIPMLSPFMWDLLESEEKIGIYGQFNDIPSSLGLPNEHFSTHYMQIPKGYSNHKICFDDLLFSIYDLDKLFNQQPETDNTELLQQVADQQATIDRQTKEIADLNAELVAGKSDTPADTISEPLKGIAKVNHDKDRAKTFACIVAKFLWDMDTEKRIRTGKMANHIYALVHEFDSKATTQRPENVKEWIKSIAPDYAKKGGNEPKDPPPIILTLKN